MFIYLTNYLVFGKGIHINMLKVKDKTWVIKMNMITIGIEYRKKYVHKYIKKKNVNLIPWNQNLSSLENNIWT
jgi:hypothetical protein